MKYLDKANWEVQQNIDIHYDSANLKQLPLAILSAQKTYPEGIDVIRSIHESESKFLIISTTESRVSGPSESIDETQSSLEESKHALLRLCKEDDDYYQ